MSTNPPSLPSARTSVTAIISLIAGILGLVQVLPVIGPIVAIITGHMAKKEIRDSAGMVSGNGMATAGLVMGYVSLGLIVCSCLVVIVLLAAGVIAIPWSSYQYQYSY
jgi:hypothetical protein